MSGLCLSFPLLGCGGPDRPVTVSVSGTVMLDGQPVEGATVNFLPQDQAKGRAAVGKTDSTGKFTLSTFEAGDGAMAGSYQITVARPTLDSVAQMEKGGSVSDAEVSKEAESVGPPIPTKYSNVKTSGLTATVSESENTIPLELSSGG
jgi:hypothetical protein